MRTGCAAGLIAKGKTAVAVSCRNLAAGMACEVQPAGRYGEVRAQAQFLAIRIDEDVGPRAQGFPYRIKERACRLDNGRRDLLIPGSHEDGHQALRPSVE
jgi:hypothetical protein